MQQETVLKLNHLNHQFYELVADSFDNTRQAAWKGWSQLVPLLELQTKQKLISVCDLGCGNGRFAAFLEEVIPGKVSHYSGFDQNTALLKKAVQNRGDSQTKYSFSELDVVQSTLDETLHIPTDTNLVVLFGVLHHIPSFELRKKLFQLLSDQLKHGAVLVVSCWQFAQSDRFQTKFLPTPTDIPQSELEKEDYFLGWQDHPTAVRFCHNIDLREAQQLLSATKLHVKNTFTADGKTDNLNLYLVLEKRTQ